VAHWCCTFYNSHFGNADRRNTPYRYHMGNLTFTQIQNFSIIRFSIEKGDGSKCCFNDQLEPRNGCRIIADPNIATRAELTRGRLNLRQVGIEDHSFHEDRSADQVFGLFITETQKNTF